jgi:S-adenosyl-L-methionine hydrolase (adenosine-forming)
MTVITLTTDFGLKDGFVGTLKGVIWDLIPEAQVADISHEISPQNVLEAALVLSRAYSFFPKGTVHLAVIDPGVGTARRPIAARLGDHFFVGPDNGLFTPIIDVIEKNGGALHLYHLTNAKYWLQEVSATFHGRDIFAPAAAWLAKGIPLSELGERITDPVRLDMPRPEKTAAGWRAHITSVDRFGNLATDLPASFLAGEALIHFRIADRVVDGLVKSYGQKPAGELVALVDSENFLELAVVNGSAAREMGVKVGDIVEVIR